MESLEPSPLESALLHEFHRLYGDKGFPLPSKILITARENTGAGRYADLRCALPVPLPDCYLDLAGRFIEMDGITNGLMAVVSVRGSTLVNLEIATYGAVSWDGKERRWSLK
jgi:hypothetical protein